VKTVSNNVVKHSLVYLCKNDWWGRPLLFEILGQNDHVEANSPIFLSIFARSDSVVTPSDKKFS